MLVVFFNLLMARIMIKITIAMTRKSNTACKKEPYLSSASRHPSAHRTPNHCQSGLTNHRSASAGGMTTSPTSEETILPNAAPMMIPTAMSTTLPFMANSLNSLQCS